MRSYHLEVTVGIFVMLAIAALLWLTIRVSGLSDIVALDQGYLVTADFKNIGGLKVRSRVTIAGVPVGRVVNITFDQKTYQARVTLLVDEQVNQIPEDSTLSILTAGLLGDNYIGVTPGFETQYWQANSHVPVEQTDSALVLEQLISRFLTTQASQ